MTIEAKKYHLIEQIMAIQEEALLNRLEILLNNLTQENQALLKLIQPTREKLDIEKLAQEQNYQGVDQDEMNRLVKEIALDEPLEDLIEAVR